MRRFREHDQRQTHDLSGVWDFAYLGEVAPETAVPSNITFDDFMAVPGCFDVTPAYAGRRGLAAYRTAFYLTDTTPHRLVFDSVHSLVPGFYGRASLGRSQWWVHPFCLRFHT